ncbi:hypothetical protein [Marinitoga lauensis]|nr:hypothetical protein [Marinitoga lauensis]
MSKDYPLLKITLYQLSLFIFSPYFELSVYVKTILLLEKTTLKSA